MVPMVYICSLWCYFNPLPCVFLFYNKITYLHSLGFSCFYLCLTSQPSGPFFSSVFLLLFSLLIVLLCFFNLVFPHGTLRSLAFGSIIKRPFAYFDFLTILLFGLLSSDTRYVSVLFEY